MASARSDRGRSSTAISLDNDARGLAIADVHNLELAVELDAPLAIFQKLDGEG